MEMIADDHFPIDSILNGGKIWTREMSSECYVSLSHSSSEPCVVSWSEDQRIAVTTSEVIYVLVKISLSLSLSHTHMNISVSFTDITSSPEFGERL